MPGLANEGDFGDVVLFEYFGRVGGVFCGVVRAVFDPDGFCLKILFQAFCHGKGFCSATIGRAAGNENGFTDLLLQVGAVT